MDYGGAQRLLVLLARFTPRESYRVLVCVLQQGVALKEQIESEGAEVIVLGRARPSVLNPLRWMAYAFRSMRDIGRICRERTVTAIQCHLSDAEFIGIAAGILCKVRPVITTVHYPDLLPDRRRNEWRNLFRIGLTKTLYRTGAHAVVAVSVDVARKIEERFCVDRSKIHVVLNRIDVGAFESTRPARLSRDSLGLNPRDRLLVSVGRLMPPKGHVYLIDALARLAAKREHVRLLLVGDGDLKEDLRARIRGRRLTEHVLFLGNRSDIGEILALADVFVLPSVSEGTSLALLEAMASGKPIVATDIPGNSVVIEHGKSGLLVPPRDPAALAEAIECLLDDPETARAYASTAHALAVARYDIRRTVRELEVLWSGGSEK